MEFYVIGLTIPWSQKASGGPGAFDKIDEVKFMYFKQVNVMWIGKLQYESGFILPSHKHNFFQIFYFLEGTGSMETDYDTYSLTSDIMFLCPPGCYHEMRCDKKGTMRTIEVKFSIKNNEMYRDMKNISGCINANDTEIRNVMECLVREAVSKDTLSRDIINMEMALILIKILRRLNNKKTEGIVFLDTSISNYSGPREIFKKIFDYINNNLNTQISLEDLASIAGHNSNYLCRIFKKEFGVTPIKYINDLKLSKAKDLLRNSNMTITEIAETLGFYSVHYFSKFFKEKEDMSPLEFRKAVSNINIKLDDDFDNKMLFGKVRYN